MQRSVHGTERPTGVIAFLALAALACFACSRAEPVLACADAKGHHVTCGFQNPEDLALLDDGRTVVLSQFGGLDGAIAGSIGVFDLHTETLRSAFVGGGEESPAPGWGDAACETAPTAVFSPHGIDVATLPDGRLRLLVVNHGGREAVEIFEISGRGEATRVAWRGCALPPAGAFLNDVASLPDGGFVVTHMMDPDRQVFEMLRASLGANTGFVYEWQPGRGMQKIAGTDGPFPNGVEVSADGRELFINLYAGGELRKVSRETGELLGAVEVTRPDNVTWDRAGRLLVASHAAPLREIVGCQSLTEGACGLAFEIVSIDPRTLEREVVFRNAGAPMGGATVAIDIGGGELLMGSFAGDRVLRARRAAFRSPASPAAR